MTRGVPQGTCFKPRLWNKGFDGILRISPPVGVEIQAYADDLAILVMGKKEGLEYKINFTMDILIEWIRDKDMEVTLAKTEIILLIGRKNKEILRLRYPN